MSNHESTNAQISALSVLKDNQCFDLENCVYMATCYYNKNKNEVSIKRFFNLLGKYLVNINRWSGKRSKSCLYYATDLYEFEVRTECPEVRIKLGRCYYKS